MGVFYINLFVGGLPEIPFVLPFNRGSETSTPKDGSDGHVENTGTCSPFGCFSECVFRDEE